MTICKVQRRRHVVLPQAICNALGIEEGDFVEVQAIDGTVVMRPLKLVEAQHAQSSAQKSPKVKHQQTA